jgi:hypothetical protein
MTSQLKVVHVDAEVVEPLPPKVRMFCELYATDPEVGGNATQSYRRVYPNASYNTASVESSRILSLPSVQQFLTSLYREATERAVARLLEWDELLPLAQGILIAATQGRIRSRLQVETARYIVDRAQGTPVARNDVVVRNPESIGKALQVFSRRLAERNKKRLLSGFNATDEAQGTSGGGP